MSNYRRQDPLSEDERWADAIRSPRDRARGKKYNWRRILRLATEQPGTWVLFDRLGPDHTVSAINRRTLLLQRTQYRDWDFRAKATKTRVTKNGRRRIGMLWIMATERNPEDDQ